MLGHGPLLSGLELLPLAVALAVVAVLAGPTTQRIGPRAPTIAGLALMAVALGVLATASEETSWWPKLGLAYAGFGAGLGFVITSVRTEAMMAVEERRRALAAGTVQLSYQLGAAVGVAGIAAAVTLYGEARLDDSLESAEVTATPAQRRALSSDALAGRLGTVDVETELPQLAPAEVEGVVGAMTDAFVATMNFVMVTCAGLTTVALVVAFALLGRHPRERLTCDSV